MTERPRVRLAVWTLLVLLLAVHQVTIWRALPIDADVFALLPSDDGGAPAEVFSRIVDESSGSVWVALSGEDWQRLREAIERFTAVIATDFEVARAPTAGLLLEGLRPFRDRLATASDLDAFERETDDQLADRALARLSTPLATAGAFPFLQDPLGLASRFLDVAGAEAGRHLAVRDGYLYAELDDRFHIVLKLESRQTGLSLDGTPALRGKLDHALRTAGVPGVMAGVPLFAEAAAVEAHAEVSTIGVGSAIAVILLVVVAFGSVRPLGLVLLSLGVGVAAGLSAVVAIFGHVHLLTLVFGASLVGVAEDYGIHAMTSVAHRGEREPPVETLRRILPGLSLALLTSVSAYSALALGGFPGLLQMATFSVVGLTAAFLTVVGTLELFSTSPLPPHGRLPGERFAARLRPSLPRSRSPLAWSAAVLLAVGLVLGVTRVEVRDDVRALTAFPSDLVREQRQLARLIGLESPAQTVVVRAAAPDALIVAEEAAAEALRRLVADGHLSHFRRAHAFCPSQALQVRAQRLNQRLRVALAAKLEARLGQRVTFEPVSASPLTPDRVHEAFPALAMLASDQASVIMLAGLSGTGQLDVISERLSGIEGVTLEDRTARLSELMALHRSRMLGWLFAGHIAVIIILWTRYRSRCWRAYLPTLLGTVTATSTLGWLGEPFDLFAVLPLLLLTGMGVDYGIFLAESVRDDDDETWMSISVGAASTALSFGLLALSSTPALHRFGVVLLAGILTTWLTAPLLRHRSDSR